MKYLLLVMALLLSAGGFAARHKIFKRYGNVIRSADTVLLYTVAETSVDPKLHDSNKNYAGDYLIVSPLPLDSSQANALQQEVLQKSNYLNDVIKRCPFVAKYAIVFAKGKKKITIIVSTASCSKVQVYLPNHSQPSSFDLAEKNMIDATLLSIIGGKE